VPPPPGPTLLTLGRLARAAGLARSSLLHYERLGLLRPVARSAAGYRLYGASEQGRLRAIRRYREAGLTLAAIGALCAADGGGARSAATSGARPAPAVILEARLRELRAEVARLRAQQRQLARLLAAPAMRSGLALDKAQWVALLRRAGFGEADMRRWHAEFEAERPDEHAAFLASLGLPAREIRAIRQRAAGPWAGRPAD
jgi:DNA-binding transcriptional MerR regulator